MVNDSVALYLFPTPSPTDFTRSNSLLLFAKATPVQTTIRTPKMHLT